MRQKQWAVIFLHWPLPPIDLLHACRPDNLQVVPNKGSAYLIAQRKRAAGIHPGKPAFTPPVEVVLPMVAKKPRAGSLKRELREGPERQGRVLRNVEEKGKRGRQREEAKEIKAGKQAVEKSSLEVGGRVEFLGAWKDETFALDVFLALRLTTEVMAD